MNAGAKIAASTYARRIAAALEEAGAGSAVLSPKDWALIDDWHTRGVPLALVLETLRERQGRPGTLARRGLRTIAAAVEDSWETVHEGRAPGRTARESGAPTATARIASWRRARRRAANEPLGRVLGRLLDRAARGGDPAELDRLLDAELEAVCEVDLLAEARAAAGRALARYRGRMSEAALEASRRRFVLDRIRAELELPRLALGDPG